MSFFLVNNLFQVVCNETQKNWIVFSLTDDQIVSDIMWAFVLSRLSAMR